jgi:tRNA pseudouridine38-40 synthase
VDFRSSVAIVIRVDRPSQRYKLTIAYRGTRYFGWQEQLATGKGSDEETLRYPPGTELPTIQLLCRRAIEGVVNHPILLTGSSRTDRGVHAKGQVAHFDTHMVQIPKEGLRRAVNARLPDDILIRSIEPVPDTFEAISGTESKRYQYVVWNAPDRPPLFSDLVFHRWQKLDLDAMRAAAALLEGTHDFNAFAKPGHGRATTDRTVSECRLSVRSPRLVLGVAGSGFLWNMVRIIAGTLIEVGIGHYTPEDIRAALESKDRRQAGSTAPPHGLYLQGIKFKSEG